MLTKHVFNFKSLPIVVMVICSTVQARFLFVSRFLQYSLSKIHSTCSNYEQNSKKQVKIYNLLRESYWLAFLKNPCQIFV
jgi:hypothetical protein